MSSSKLETFENALYAIDKKNDAYGFYYGKISKEQEIRDSIQANHPVFLHGLPGDGKSARVKAIDPKCIEIYLSTATLEDLNGKTAYSESEGKAIKVKPTWLEKIEEQSKKEPNKLHILFFDELTNALPTVQKLVLKLISERKVSGKWKLPDNVRIVAAGNEIEDSSSANEMLEPLHSRFDHVEINTTADDWMQWAITEDSNIEPSIIAYIAYRKDKALRTPYTGKAPNADPRKWEMASKVLNSTHNPEMLRALLGNETTQDYISFCKQPTISLEDILSGNYTEEDAKSLTKKQVYASFIEIANIDENNIIQIIDFIDNLNFTITWDAYDMLYDMWVRGNKERAEKLKNRILEKISELQVKREEVANNLLELEDKIDEYHEELGIFGDEDRRIKHIKTPENNEQGVSKRKRAKKAIRVEEGFEYDYVTEEEIAHGMINSNIPVFLHGLPGDGKTARVKQIDPECIEIDLCNSEPEDLNGISIYHEKTGKIIDIPPTWLEELKEKCKKEPDKIHILFFDELTNATPNLQAMTFNLILNREVNGKWKLPDNVRIVAAGNEIQDSMVANELSQPLFGRFAHAYIKTTVEDWLKWAQTEEANIHPAVYAYIAYAGEKALRTPYTGEKPNADPRKWERVSQEIWSKEKAGEPFNIRGIEKLIGEDLGFHFEMFCKSQRISIEDVLNGNYIEDEVKAMRLDEKYATAVGLSAVDEENVEAIRDFALRNLGEEICSTFDSLWTRGNEKRLERIAELIEEQMYLIQLENEDSLESLRKQREQLEIEEADLDTEINCLKEGINR